MPRHGGIGHSAACRLATDNLRENQLGIFVQHICKRASRPVADSFVVSLGAAAAPRREVVFWATRDDNICHDDHRQIFPRTERRAWLDLRATRLLPDN